MRTPTGNEEMWILARAMPLTHHIIPDESLFFTGSLSEVLYLYYKMRRAYMKLGYLGFGLKGREKSGIVCVVQNLDPFPPTQLNTNSSTFIISSLSLREKF